MRTLWVVEKSKTVREMVKIALRALPVELRFASAVSELISSTQSAHEPPELLVCAERLQSRVAGQPIERFRDLRDQLVALRAARITCPVLILLDQRGGGSLSEDQIRSFMHRAGVGYVGSVRKPFKTQVMVEAVARALAIQAPHAEIFAEQHRVIPLARHSKVAPQPVITAEVASEHAQTAPPQSAQIDTPTPTTMGNLLQSATPDSARPQQILKSASYQATSTTHHSSAADLRDLSPSITPPPNREISSPEIAALSHPQIEGDWLESREQASASPETSQGGLSDELNSGRDSGRDSGLDSKPIGEPTHEPNSEPTHELDTELNAPALSFDDDAAAQQGHAQGDLSGDEVASEPSDETSVERALSMAREAVHRSTERALKVAMRAQEAHGDHLSPDEARALIERVAWEVVPVVARDVLSELIDAELTQDRRLS